MQLVANLPPHELVERRRAVESVRATLGDGPFRAVVAEAAAMPVDDASLDAIDRLDRLLDAAPR